MLLRLPEMAKGYNPITDMNGTGADMLMDIGVQEICKGDSITFNDPQKETALLLMNGEVSFKYGGKEQNARRTSLLDESPSTLHVSKGTSVAVEAKTEASILIQKTDNEKEFEAKYYGPNDCTSDIFGDGVWNNCARRVVRTVFDLSNAPYSNMVLGEVINYPGRWSSYIPHGHDQPEVYYYRFDRPEGFGAAFIGEDAYKIVDNSALCIPGGPTHPQATAPGYAMWYAWMIRHLDNNPWNSRDNDPRYEWLLKEDAKIWPDK